MLMDQLTMEHSQETKGDGGVCHIPVMLNEVTEYLRPKAGGIFVDGTVGLGGHAQAILSLIGPGGRLIGIDRDAQALAVARENLAAYGGQWDLIHGNYCHMDGILADLHVRKVDGVLLDLGLSSFQLDHPERGFSFRAEGPLDMRMDQDSYISAFDLVNSLSEQEISSILRDFGQERWHRRIARLVVQQRSKKPIETTTELSSLVLRAVPYRNRREKIHPATRTFLAFRIAVNRELEVLEAGLDKCIDALKEGGRIAVIAFHSLEDRIVKQKFRALAKAETLHLVVKKPLRPSAGESELNPRARSARLRVAERKAA